VTCFGWPFPPPLPPLPSAPGAPAPFDPPGCFDTPSVVPDVAVPVVILMMFCELLFYAPSRAG
jgi:hypothetical protein